MPKLKPVDPVNPKKPKLSTPKAKAPKKSSPKVKPPQVKETQKNNPLHGVKLADVLDYLLEVYGWEELGKKINIRCFNHDPSVNSSLKFLRKTPWAREKVENLYLYTLRKA